MSWVDDKWAKWYPNDNTGERASLQKPEVDAYEFITSSSFLNIDLRPWQSIAIKTFYNLWVDDPSRGIIGYPPTAEEQVILDKLKNEWGIVINTTTPTRIREMILVDGRRSGKSSLMSFIAAYEVYSLICKGDPQAYYNMLERHPISITHIAVNGDQAGDMFQFTKDRMRGCSFFKPFFDYTKYNESEMRIFTPYDLRENARIAKENERVPAAARQKPLEGSIMIQSLTTRASSKRGKAIKLLIFSEYAHFERPKFDSTLTENILSEETQQTDYAMWKAMKPSVEDFGEDGRILYESTPREKGGQFYNLYCEAGGMEQDKPEEAARPEHMSVLQLATWDCNPNITRESLDSEFRKDPAYATMEYGARFSNVSGNFISESIINSIPQPDVPMIRVCNRLDRRFVVSVDPGGQAKKKLADTYVVSWGHYQMGDPIYWIDGFQGWHETVVSMSGGGYQKIAVDPTEVTKFIIDLVNDLGRNFVLEIVYDQWQSSESIANLQRLGLPSLETFYTNQYKAEMYGNFLSLAQYNRIKSYGVDIGGYINQWKQELKYLQRYISGGTMYYSHPSTGPVQHDDFADAAANLIYRLSLLANPTRQSMEDRVRQNLAPTVRPKQIAPVRGGNLAYRGARMATFSGGSGGGRNRSISDRIHR
jgi:hypothetical protein